MKSTRKFVQALIVVAAVASTTHAFASDKTNEGARSTRPGEVVKKSKDGIEIHELRGAEKADRERAEQRAKEAKEKKPK